MPSERKAFALRLDPTLHDAIARLASAELRSVNAEIEFLLREALRARGVRLDANQAEDNNNNGGE
ncbi:MAG: Arc family DNA-binding protein [Alphaproteobacteria bacterium]|nr:Arc family DNA-binding protein [Alphaproteobacteria bacterium]